MRFPNAGSVLSIACLMASFSICPGLANASVGQLKWSLNLGGVKVGQSKTETVIFTNNGTASLTISKYVVNAPGFSVKGLALPVSMAVGQSLQFNLVFAPLDGRVISGNIVFYSNASDSVLGINVNGHGLTCGTLSESPGGISFGDVPVGTSLQKLEKLTNTSTCDITLLQVNVSGSEFSRSSLSLPMTLAPGQSVSFNVKFAPTAMGTIGGSMAALSSATDSRLVSGLSGTGSSKGQLSISPSTLNFGNVIDGQGKTETVTVTASSASVSVTSASLSSSEFQLSGLSLPLTLAAGQSKSFTVKFTPKVTGTATGKLSVASNASNSPGVESLAGVGVSAPVHSVTLSWSDTSSGVAGYNVYRASQSTGPFAKLNAALDSNKSYVDSSVLAGQTYYYAVTAVSGGVESSRSFEVKATIPSP